MSDEVQNVPQNKAYDASSISVLEGLEAVRARPGMYIGSIASRGLHHLVWEVVDNSVDEALAGFCTHIEIAILPGDGREGIRVVDNGRGIPTAIHPEKKIGTLQLVLTELHAGGKFDKDSYKMSAGMNGVGVSCVNALSTKLIATVRRDERVVRQEFNCGVPLAPQAEIGIAEKGETGTTIEFYPDETVFKETEIKFDYDILAQRSREIAYLMKGLTLTLTDERDPENIRTESFCYPDGLPQYIRDQDAHRTPIFENPIHLTIDKEENKYPLEIAMWYNTGYMENLHSFVNNVNTVDGGTHVSGFKAALTRVVKKFINEMPKAKNKKDVEVTAEDVREGLTAVISIKIAEPMFDGQTKHKLGNSDVDGYVNSAFGETLEEFFRENPKYIKPIAEKVLQAAQGREAARHAKDSVRRKSPFEGGGLPGKLADCSSRKPEECELFIVEGDSAGGSAKTGRNRDTQAILPLRGKILNVEKASLHRILQTEEILNLMNAIGTGINEECKLDKLRYHKIIIMTDADVDGSHIQTLLLTLFFRNMKPLIEAGHIYIVQPPLYRIRWGKSSEQYLYSEDEKNKKLDEIAQEQKRLDDAAREQNKEAKKINYTLTRFKGLGEMSAEQLFETTMKPMERKLKRCSIKDADIANEVFSMLMGEDVAPRRKFIEEQGHTVEHLLDI